MWWFGSKEGLRNILRKSNGSQNLVLPQQTMSLAVGQKYTTMKKWIWLSIIYEFTGNGEIQSISF